MKRNPKIIYSRVAIHRDLNAGWAYSKIKKI